MKGAWIAASIGVVAVGVVAAAWWSAADAPAPAARLASSAAGGSAEADAAAAAAGGAAAGAVGAAKRPGFGAAPHRPPAGGSAAAGAARSAAGGAGGASAGQLAGAAGGRDGLARAGDGLALPGGAGPAAKPAVDRAHELPDAKQHREQVQRDVAVEPPTEQPDVLLSVPFKGAVDTEAGVPPTSAEGLSIGQDGAVQFGDDAMVQFQADGNINGEAGTIGFEIVPEWAGSDQTNQSFVQVLSGDNVWENRISLVKNLDTLRFILIDNTGVERNVGLQIGDWAPGEAHRVTATWGDALMSLYVDGRLVGQNTFEGNLQVSPGGPIYLGYNKPGGAYVGPGGAISDFKIYSRTLDQSEVR